MENKTIADIERIIALGKPRRVVEKFIELYRAGLEEGEPDLSLPIEEELDEKEFKERRAKNVASAKVTVSSGLVFSANERAITRMSEVIQSVQVAIELGMIADPDADYPLQWVLHGAKSGEGTSIMFADLLEAFALANQLRSQLWLKENS